MKSIWLGLLFTACTATAFGQTPTSQPSVAPSFGQTANGPAATAPSNCQGAFFDNRVPRSIVIIQGVPGPAAPTRPHHRSPARQPNPARQKSARGASAAPDVAANAGSLSGIGSIGSGVAGLGSSGVGRMESSGVGSIGTLGVGAIGMPPAPTAPPTGRHVTAPPIAIAPPLATAPPLFATVCY